MNSVIAGLSMRITKLYQAPITVWEKVDFGTTFVPAMDLWQTDTFCMPPGEHVLILTGVQGEESATDIAIDNIHHMAEKCNSTVVIDGNANLNIID